MNGRISGFADRQGVAGIGNHAASDGYDNANGIALDGNRMIWTWKLEPAFLSCFGLQSRAQPFARSGANSVKPLQ